MHNSMHFESSSKIEAKSLELGSEELKSYVKLGYFQKFKNREEHITVHPCWLNNMKGGISTELSATLGKWNQKLAGYLIGYEKPKLKSTLGAVNEDHKWIHVDICATFYVYQPEVDHQLKGIIQKKGNSAAICTVFNVFTCTVFPADDTEFESWSAGDEIEFSIYSFINRRKGPILRGRSAGNGFNYNANNNSSKSKKIFKTEENWAEEDNWVDESEGVNSKTWAEAWDESGSKARTEEPHEETEETSPKKKKKKKDKKHNEEFEEVVIKKIKSEPAEESEESPSKKSKKKKKKKDRYSEGD